MRLALLCDLRLRKLHFLRHLALQTLRLLLLSPQHTCGFFRRLTLRRQQRLVLGLRVGRFLCLPSNPCGRFRLCLCARRRRILRSSRLPTLPKLNPHLT